MEDTPKHIRDLQLKIWLSKSPSERLRLALLDNEALYLTWKKYDDERKKTTAKLK
jgi:hypothetical protein